MSKIVFLGLPAQGHTNPMLPVIRELHGRGEQVTVYNGEAFRAAVEQTGATFSPYPAGTFGSADLANLLREGNLPKIGPLIMNSTAALLPYLLEALPAENPDLIVFDSLALWGKMTARSLGRPHVASISHFIFDDSMLFGESAIAIRMVLQALPAIPAGIRPRRALNQAYKDIFPVERPLIPVRGDLNILYTTRELQPKAKIIDKTFRFVGPSIDARTRDEYFPFESLGEEPLIYISLGTMNLNQASFIRACFEAFADVPGRFVLSAGQSWGDGEAVGDVPGNFIVRPSVPQLEVLERADVFITHGGLNSIHEGLYYGVPLILVPQQIEQLLNARCVEKHGAGLVIPNRLAGKAITAADLRPALETVRTQPGYRQAANRMMQDLRSTGGYRQAADEIQALLSDGRAAD